MADAAAKAEAVPAAEDNSGAGVDEAGVLKQLQFYFSDSNLPRDKFLKGLVDKADDGWVDLSVIASFKRMKTLAPGSNLEVIGNIVKNAEDAIIEVSEDNSKIRRSPSHPLPSENVCNKRSIYSKGWDLESTTIETVEKYFSDKEFKVLSVRLRRMPATKEFKGSAFVELSSVEDAEKCVAAKHTVGENDMIVEMKEAYHERKKSELVAKRKEKSAAKAAQKKVADEEKAAEDKKEQEEAEKYENGLVLSFEGTTEETSREDLKEVFGKFGTVGWVDFQRGETKGSIRFDAAEEGAKKAADVKEAYDKEPVEINGNKLTLTVLEGDDEKAFWQTFYAEQRARRTQQKNKKGGGKSWGNKGRNNKRRGDDAGGRSSKRSRT